MATAEDADPSVSVPVQHEAAGRTVVCFVDDGLHAEHAALRYRVIDLPRFALTTSYNPSVNRAGIQVHPDAELAARIVGSFTFVDVEVDELAATASDKVFGYPCLRSSGSTSLRTHSNGALSFGNIPIPVRSWSLQP